MSRDTVRRFHLPSATISITAFFAASFASLAGSPFITDDPEPVELHHWEVYVASQWAHNSGGWSGTLPHVEINYGAIPNLQLHVIAPLGYSAPSGAASRYGYGDTEFGAKYRFVQESDRFPQIGVFPLLEAPTGDASRGLGSGHAAIFLPIWLQKTFGKWVAYGGGGYWINPGADDRNWGYTGALLHASSQKISRLGWKFSTKRPRLATAPTRPVSTSVAFGISTTIAISSPPQDRPSRAEAASSRTPPCSSPLARSTKPQA